MIKIKFPQDNQAHDHIIEWWYYNGHLKDKSGNSYAYMDCLFRAKTKEVKIPLISHWPVSPIYFSHSLLSDIGRQKFYPTIDYYSAISRDSFTKPLLYANYLNPLGLKSGFIGQIIEEIKPGNFHLKTENLDLTLMAVKPPLLLGGTGYLTLNTRSTYYYSYTNLKTSGTIIVDGKKIAVTGQSWFDHQWADVAYAKDHWTWFSIQLNNKTEIVCFDYYDQNKKNCLAGFSFADGRQFHTDQVIIKPKKDIWTSSDTGATYQLSWQIEIPKQQTSLIVKPKVKNQEMIFGQINYWEGPMKVQAKINGQKLKGKGFMELVGYPSDYNYLFLKGEEVEESVLNKFKKLKLTLK